MTGFLSPCPKVIQGLLILHDLECGYECLVLGVGKNDGSGAAVFQCCENNAVDYRPYSTTEECCV